MYQRMAWAYAALLFTSTNRPQVRSVRAYDGVDPQSGPWFDSDHPRLTDQSERERDMAYLRHGEILLHTTALLDDVVDRDRTGRVPASFRTDGTWIWTDSVPYYLAEHMLSPDPEFLGHIREQDYRPPVVDSVALHRAMAALTAPQKEAVWTASG